MSFWLSRWRVPHLLLERGRIAERWRSERWDSLRFQFPNWGVELPGFAYAGKAPDDFAGRDEICRLIAAYADFINAPVREGVEVRRLGLDGDSFAAETGAGTIVARNVVVATGPYQRPALPSFAAELGAVFQLHTSAYRNPARLPAGGVLIVGAGASGVQIAAELAASGREVWLAVGSHRRVPRRYRGYDFHHWEYALGEWDRTSAQRPAEEPPPLLTGVAGGHEVDLRGLAGTGVTLTGRVTGIHDGVATFARDLEESLAAGDAHYDRFVAAIDVHALMKNLALPPTEPSAPRPLLPCVSDPLRRLDLAAARIGSVIWATGYRLDFEWIDLPVFAAGKPIHDRGISPIPGLYFLGLPWLSKRKSTLLAGVGEDAEHLAAHIAARRRHDEGQSLSDRR
ncbi:NAD(P)-binding domain-containing protein [Sphingomonas ginsengisoli (ex An et al. 2013)]|nr:NAD(P)-binding domain-containing protein [Sphingomonas ginsengisoli An et al. 2013]